MHDLSASAFDEGLIRRICGEYLEMPGLQLTLSQARRLFGVPEDACAALFDQMVHRGLLAQRPDGRYCLGLRRYARAAVGHPASGDPFRMTA